MKRFLVFVLIICMAFLYVGAQETEPEEVQEEEIIAPAEPVEKPVTRLNVTLIDGMNDKLVKLDNCIVHVRGELHILEDSFDYTKTFLEGDRYEITIHVRLKK